MLIQPVIMSCLTASVTDLDDTLGVYEVPTFTGMCICVFPNPRSWGSTSNYGLRTPKPEQFSAILGNYNKIGDVFYATFIMHVKVYFHGWLVECR